MTKLGCCLFWSFMGIGGGGITAWLILALAPGGLDLPLPIWVYLPFAAVGVILPLIIFSGTRKAFLKIRDRFFVHVERTSSDAKPDPNPEAPLNDKDP